MKTSGIFRVPETPVLVRLPPLTSFVSSQRSLTDEVSQRESHFSVLLFLGFRSDNPR